MASDYIRDFLDATKHLKEAADQLRKSSGGKPLGQSLIEAAKAMALPGAAKDAAGRRTISEMYGFDPKPYRDDKTPGPPPQPPDKFKADQFDMIRALVARTARQPDGKSDPRRMTPTKFSKYTRLAARAVGQRLARTRVGQFVASAAKTRAGKAIGGVVMRAAGGAAARTGVSVGAGAAAGGGALAAGASVLTGVGIVVGALALVGTALYAFGKVVVAASDKQLDAMRQYEKVSAGMAIVFANADMRDTLRNMERGERLAPSAQALSNADQKLKDNSSELIVLGESIRNTLLALLESGIADLVGPLNEMARGIIDWLKRNGLLKEGAQAESFSDFLDRVAADTEKSLQAGNRWQAAARADRPLRK
jgi:hypothetical protein